MQVMRVPISCDATCIFICRQVLTVFILTSLSRFLFCPNPSKTLLSSSQIKQSSNISTLTKRFASACLHPIRSYTGGKESGGVEVKAASLAEEFKRVSEEKANQDRVVKDRENKGSSSSSSQTAQDVAQESAFGESDIESAVKHKYKEPLNRHNE